MIWKRTRLLKNKHPWTGCSVYLLKINNNKMCLSDYRVLNKIWSVVFLCLVSAKQSWHTTMQFVQVNHLCVGSQHHPQSHPTHTDNSGWTQPESHSSGSPSPQQQITSNVSVRRWADDERDGSKVCQGADQTAGTSNGHQWWDWYGDHQGSVWQRGKIPFYFIVMDFNFNDVQKYNFMATLESM